jgi:hypothetical protein
LKAALDAQLSVVIICCICGILMGILWPIYMLFLKHLYINKPTKLLIANFISPIFGLAKISALISAIVTFGKVSN